MKRSGDLPKLAKPIACELHDYLEVACLYGYDIRISLIEDSVIEGQALTTRTGSDKIEYLTVKTGSHTADVAMQEISSVTAITPNPYFSIVSFS